MIKRVFNTLLLLFVFMSTTTVLDASEHNKKYTLTYLYTNNCSYCVRFEPVYQKLFNKYNSNYSFKKFDAHSELGARKARLYRITHVPFVIVENSESKEAINISPSCLIRYACVDRVLENF